MQARDLATQNFAVAEHLLQLHELFRGLHEEQATEPLRLAVCRCMELPETSALRHARNEQVLIAARATAPIPPSLLIEEGLDFLLRQAVVVACTALESFFWDALRENVITIVRARKRGADDSLKKLTLTLDDYLSLESFENYDDRLQEIILKNFERGTLYDTSSIERIARILTVTQFWPQIAKKCGLSETDIQKQLSELIKRRNQVAHRADRPDERANPPEEQDGHGLRAISYSWAHSRVATAKTVVSAASEIFGKTLGQLKKQLKQEAQQEEEQKLARETLSKPASASSAPQASRNTISTSGVPSAILAAPKTPNAAAAEASPASVSSSRSSFSSEADLSGSPIDIWKRVIAEVRQKKPILRVWVEAGTPIDIDSDNNLTIGFPDDQDFAMVSLSRPVTRRFIEETLFAVTGKPLSVNFEHRGGLQSTPPKEASPAPSGEQASIADSEEDLASTLYDLWNRMVAEVRRKKPLLRVWVEAGTPLGLENGTFTIGFPEDQAFAMSSLSKPSTRRFLEELLFALTGKPLSVKLEQLAKP